ncbi:hypothetical protein PsorP6_009890 [Peronosclerospora sorghi]|uniref:Uncharacterized protein n=1 Tax=Peronosclerospora sorghi TaxID=230839 RepID=A0ACC0W0R1_9STRA|nr:hypothetical protein PsorP6_009890 [Peronosclerospora sorghi]
MNKFAKSQGYAVVKRRRTKGNRRIYFICVHGRNPDTVSGGRKILPEGSVYKNKGSKIKGCPFDFVAKLHSDGLYRVCEIREGGHNHVADDRADLFAVSPDTVITQQRVYNAIKKAKKADLNGRTSLETLIEELEDRTQWVAMKVSVHDLNFAAEELSDLMMMANDAPNEHFTGSLTKAFDIHCKQRILALWDNGEKLSVTEFHEQWSLKGKLNSLENDGSTSEPHRIPLEERLAAFSKLSEAQQAELLAMVTSRPLYPLPQRTKGRPPGAKSKHVKGANGTHLDSSFHKNVSKRAVTCIACKTAGLPAKGHIKSSADCPSRAGPSS